MLHDSATIRDCLKDFLTKPEAEELRQLLSYYLKQEFFFQKNQNGDGESCIPKS